MSLDERQKQALLEIPVEMIDHNVLYSERPHPTRHPLQGVTTVWMYTTCSVCHNYWERDNPDTPKRWITLFRRNK